MINEIVVKCYVCNKHQIGNDRELHESGWLHFADTNKAICKECRIRLSKRWRKINE